MLSVSTALKVHYNQKLGDPSGHLGGMHHGLWGIDAPVTSKLQPSILTCCEIT